MLFYELVHLPPTRNKHRVKEIIYMCDFLTISRIPQSNSCWGASSELTDFRRTVEQSLISLHVVCWLALSCPLSELFSPRSAGRKWAEGECTVTICAQLVWIIQPLRCIRQLPLHPIINHPLLNIRPDWDLIHWLKAATWLQEKPVSQSCNSHHAFRNLHIFEQLHSVLSWRKRKSGVHFRQLTGSCFPLLDISKVCQLVNL